ncbi:MAG: M23 family metallopeptidase, partial [Acidobacteriota bacterium]
MLFFILAFCAPGSNGRSAVSIEAKPEKVYIERSEANQYVNFDMLVTNSADEKLVINKIELTVFDAADKLVHRAFVDEYGRLSPELLSHPTIDKKTSVLIYNPIHTFSTTTPLDRMHYEFSFTSEDRKRTFSASTDVRPVYYQTKTDLILPIKGRVLVWDGHDYASHHRRFDYTNEFFVKQGQKTNFQRYGYDFVLVDENGLNYKGRNRTNDDWYESRPDTLEDYFSFGEPVFAAGAGRVAAMHDGDEDDRTVNQANFASDERAYGGNYVVIDHLNGEFSWFGHLKKGTVLVKVGQTVKQGEAIGAMGASGSSLFPHLHYELRDGSGAKIVNGLPSYFSHFRRLLGSKPVKVKRG